MNYTGFKQFLIQKLPEIFPAKDLDILTDKLIKWRRVQNLRTDDRQLSEPTIPANIFIKDGKDILIQRDPFLDWWLSRMA